MTFLRLTLSSTAAEILVNPAQILYVQPDAYGTNVHLVTGKMIAVTNRVDDIEQMVAEQFMLSTPSS
jgi:DNA-binding LytR/AlgR family response regulator